MIPSGDTATQEPTGGRWGEGKALPANTLLSGQGIFASPNGPLAVEIVWKSQGCVGFMVWYSPQGDKSGAKVGLGGATAYSEKDLILCWDEKGQLWVYHPTEFVSCYRIVVDDDFRRVFVGSGRDVRDQVPSAFREALPKDIERAYSEATRNGCVLGEARPPIE